MKRFLVVIITLLFISGMAFSADWILDSKSGKLPADLATLLVNAGGTLVKSLDEVGVAVADFATREDAEAMEAHGFDVMPDVSLNWLPGAQQTNYLYDHAEHIGQDESYYGYQWHLPVIGAPAAWDAGFTGQGARVAVVDSGVMYLHPDLYNNIDFEASATFVPGTADFIDDNGHGTHVSGIVAAADNAYGTIGVAPNATIIGVKVLSSTGSGNISWIAQGIIHAANQNVDIINLSLGGTLKKNGYAPYYTASDVSYYVNLYRKALTYAKQQGALVICSAGNDSLDMDHDGNLIHTPNDTTTGVIVSATGPLGLQNFDRFASYSNYGRSSITVAAPGGDYANYPAPGWHLDMILSCSLTGWNFMAGTSMAAPVASGVAALIVSKYGTLTPAKLESKLVKSADDLGQPGTDPYYGKGRVNAAKAVQ